jgi:hypothetical protein
VALARRFLSQRWPLSMTKEGLPPTFFSILIFATHAHLASLLLNTICFTSLATWRVSGPLQWSLPSAVTHLQSLTTWLCPGTQQLTYFRRLFTNSLVALDSVCVIVSKIRSFLRANEVFTWTFLFSNARWLFNNLQLSKQSNTLHLVISLNNCRQRTYAARYPKGMLRVF